MSAWSLISFGAADRAILICASRGVFASMRFNSCAQLTEMAEITRNIEIRMLHLQIQRKPNLIAARRSMLRSCDELRLARDEAQKYESHGWSELRRDSNPTTLDFWQESIARLTAALVFL